MSEPIDIKQTFELLRAEAETSWLDRVFLPPREFDLMVGSHSILVLGGDGSGKTALEIQLKSITREKGTHLLLIASWRLQPLAELSSSGQIVSTYLEQAMDSLSIAFLEKISQNPEIYSSVPTWANNFMVWFVQRYLQSDRDFHLSRLSDRAVPGGLKIARHLLYETPHSLFPQHIPITTIMPHLTGAVKSMGFEGIWIFVEGLDAHFRLLPDRLEKFLYDFLSTLEFFEDPAFAFKIIVPEKLGKHLKESRGVVTRRFKTYDIKWKEEELISIVEERIALTLGCEKIAINKLCKDDKWLEWLKRFAGDTPRGWLDLTRPILAVYLQNNNKSLSRVEWQAVYRESPPQLHLETEVGRVFIGYGEVVVTGIGYKLLEYLYENRHRPCTKSELYYCAHKGLQKEPHNKDDEGWEDTPAWEGILDTALWRLRQVIEWDTRKSTDHLYIVSERRRGQIHLENVA